jgi:EAL domain-containing protein (putative c-di-GMP-specific phosphodiesterase class I)
VSVEFCSLDGSAYIDRDFIMNITEDGLNSDLARIIILMSRALGLNVIAEGVETENQMQFLLKHDCSEAQGYHISRPLPAVEFESLLQARMYKQQDQVDNLTLF